MKCSPTSKCSVSCSRRTLYIAVDNNHTARTALNMCPVSESEERVIGENARYLILLQISKSPPPENHKILEMYFFSHKKLKLELGNEPYKYVIILYYQFHFNICF